MTEAFDYNQTSHLADFFHCYSKATPVVHEIDETVSVPTSQEARLARVALQLDDSVPLVRLSVPCGNPSQPSQLYYVVPTPEIALYTPPGRATRGFKAYDILHSKVVFLKDTWRINLPDIEPEGKTYRTLNAANVDHVPRCLASGDISTAEHHATKTSLYTTQAWARATHCPLKSHFIPHRHYRVVLDVVGHSLVKYSSSYEMVSAVRDAIIGEFL